MSSFLIKSAAVTALGCVAEKKYFSGLECKENIFMLTPTVLLGVGFWSLTHGFKVGAARKKYMELAEKEGEKDVEARYALPNLYAQGTSKNAKAFNCVQRSHQHIFETFSLASIGGMLGAMTFPVVAFASTLVYAVGRVVLSNGYANAEGEPSKRYSSAIAPYMWYGLVCNAVVGFVSSAFLITKKVK